MRPPRKPLRRTHPRPSSLTCTRAPKHNRWNRTLIRERGAAMGAEFRGKGVHVALAPMACVSLSSALQHVNWIH